MNTVDRCAVKTEFDSYVFGHASFAVVYCGVKIYAGQHGIVEICLDCGFEVRNESGKIGEIKTGNISDDFKNILIIGKESLNDTEQRRQESIQGKLYSYSFLTCAERNEMALSEKHRGNEVGQRLSEYFRRKQIVKRSRKVERTGYRLNEFDEFGEVDVVSFEYVYSAEQGP
ncbi:unknown [Acidaminococcus sp. CAG:917]|nr:unknown [Acidaminococcus sp. CAG:917]